MSPPRSAAQRVLLAVVAAGALGCDPCAPLADWRAPSTIAARLQASVNAALDEANAQALHPVCLSDVDVRPLSRDREGIYGLSQRRIVVDPESASVYETTMHELCHAIDLQNRLIDDGDLFMPPLDHPIRAQYRRRLWANEMFAQTCEVGPRALSLVLATACPSDPPLEGAQAVLDLAFAGLDVPTWSFVPTSRAVLPDLVQEVAAIVVNSHANGVVTVTVRETDNFQHVVSLDPATGLVAAPSDLVFPGSRIPPDVDGFDVVWSATTGTKWIAPARLDLPVGVVYRYLLADDGVVGVGTGRCQRGPEASFAAQGHLWTVSVHAGSLWFGRWVQNKSAVAR